MNAGQILAELRRRDVHVRQYFDGRRFELFADGQFQSWWSSPIETESAIRKLLGITNEEGLAVEAELARQAAIA